MQAHMSVNAEPPPIKTAANVVGAIGSLGDGHDAAAIAAKTLRDLPSDQIGVVLDVMNDATPAAQNWLRGIAGDIVRHSGPPSNEWLVTYIADLSGDPIGRAVALDILIEHFPEKGKQFVSKGLSDPSLLIREKSVAAAIESAASLSKTDKQAAIAIYRTTLAAARHPRQVSNLLSALDELGENVTASDTFVMITNWKVIASFDNVGGVGFDRVYPPEADFTDDGKLDFTESYEGKNGDVKWQDIAGDNNEGAVDVAAAFEKEKGAVAYLYVEFESTTDQPAQMRLGCANATKAWLDGKEVMSNQVYHSGSMIDQYTANVRLSKGSNRILLKVCQNEQTEPWAQDWKFQFRLTDLTGKGLKSGN